MTEHSSIGIGGSSAARVVACPPSRLIANEPQPETQWTRNGTLLHTAMEMWLTSSPVKKIEEQLPEELHGKFHQARRAFVVYMEGTGLAGAAWHVEQRVHLTPVPGAFGTIDLLAEHSTNEVTMLDWKFGDGVQVYAENNAQLMFYAAAAVTDPATKHMFNGKTKINLVIVQPNDRGLPVVRVAETDLAELLFFTARVKWAVENGHRDELLSAGDHCRFCPVKPVCPELKRKATQALEWNDPHQLTPEQIGKALEMAEELEGWIKSVRDYSHERLEHGRKVDGWKLVPRRATRRWKNEAQAYAILREFADPEEITTTSLRTVAQVEKIVDVPEDLYEKKSSGTTLARADDPRPEATSATQVKAAAERLKAFTI